MHIHRKFWSHFFSRSYALFELRKLTKMKDTTETVGQHNSTETAQQNCMKFVVMKDIMCRCAFLQEMLVDPFEEQFISPFLSDCPSLMPFIVYSILKHCRSVGYVSLLTLSFILSVYFRKLWVLQDPRNIAWQVLLSLKRVNTV